MAAVALAAVAMPVGAQPIAPPGTEGLKIIAANTQPVVAKYLGNSASFTNWLYLVRPPAQGGDLFLFDNHATPVGTEVNLGSFAVGTELIFRLRVTNTGYDYFTGPSSRNPDNKAHARVQAEWQPGTTLVSFEDLYDTPEAPGGYNDLSFSFTNTVSSTVPEPSTYALFAAGLAGLGVAARRRRRG